ncbi:hypothetical protein ACJIZ3_011122 [Penstemon smallii]|uniref:Uncharacterized protein n=1 Tax=Penstemon smallii TaxID=265156 RepID=A0ABD3UJR2_9LAMI
MVVSISTNCCLNIFPPPPNSTSISFPISTTAEIVGNSKEIRSWKSRCVVGFTCAIIGLELGNFGAIALDSQLQTIRVQKWSDKIRACDPWRVNSLETIVPENLPRSSTRRRWEGIGLFGAAPPLKFVQKSGTKSCFNL